MNIEAIKSDLLDQYLSFIMNEQGSQKIKEIAAHSLYGKIDIVWDIDIKMGCVDAKIYRVLMDYLTYSRFPDLYIDDEVDQVNLVVELVDPINEETFIVQYDVNTGILTSVDLMPDSDEIYYVSPDNFINEIELSLEIYEKSYIIETESTREQFVKFVNYVVGL